MENGIRMGVKLINDVSGLSYDPKTINIRVSGGTSDRKTFFVKPKSYLPS